MSKWRFEKFCSSIASKANTNVRFNHSDGNFIAICDDVILIANQKTGKITVNWGDKHCSTIMP